MPAPRDRATITRPPGTENYFFVDLLPIQQTTFTVPPMAQVMAEQNTTDIPLVSYRSSILRDNHVSLHATMAPRNTMMRSQNPLYNL
jgi:hypothetical protein